MSMMSMMSMNRPMRQARRHKDATVHPSAAEASRKSSHIWIYWADLPVT